MTDRSTNNPGDSRPPAESPGPTPTSPGDTPTSPAPSQPTVPQPSQPANPTSPGTAVE